jgi:hypothetical protein
VCGVVAGTGALIRYSFYLVGALVLGGAGIADDGRLQQPHARGRRSAELSCSSPLLRIAIAAFARGFVPVS